MLSTVAYAELYPDFVCENDDDYPLDHIRIRTEQSLPERTSRMQNSVIFK